MIPIYDYTLDVAALVRAESDRLGHVWFPGKAGDYDLNLWGVRAANDTANLFDDLLGCSCLVGGAWRSWVWAGTTDPGRATLANPTRRAGTAILVPDQYRGLWRIGLHKGKYPALVQTGKARVWRDNDRDGELDRTGPVYDDVQGLNQHKAGQDSRLVESWSAACQVHRRAATFDTELMPLAREQVAHGHGETFSYTLYDVRDSPSLSALWGIAGRRPGG